MPQISAIVLTLNEERNIGRCLDSLQGVVDEIVVIHSFSTDRTAEIVAGYDARFIQQKFLGYIEQKNFGLTKVSFDHVLSLDADEALSPELKASILVVKSNFECAACASSTFAPIDVPADTNWSANLKCPESLRIK